MTSPGDQLKTKGNPCKNVDFHSSLLAPLLIPKYTQRVSRMIIYDNSCFGIFSLTRVHGSAVYKTLLPALLSSSLVVMIHQIEWKAEEVVGHPYSFGAFVGFFSFLLTFRLNYGYQRYWEGATAVHQMMSKWLDCTMCLSAFHYQSEAYDDIRPPTFGSTPEANDKSVKGRDRRFYSSQNLPPSNVRFAEQSEHEGEISTLTPSIRRRKFPWQKRLVHQRSSGSLATIAQKEESRTEKSKSINSVDPTDKSRHKKIPIPQRFQEQFTLQQHQQPGDGSGRGRNLRGALQRQDHLHNLVKQRKARVPLPSLFLQEWAHLASLLSAVALSTLRNDNETAESPLTEYIPGKPWPPVDPDSLSHDIKKQYDEGNVFWRGLYFCLGLSRSRYRRTLYNAARPFSVLGGVSDDEIRLLQQARGPYAKVSLCSMWAQEFISREYLHGSTGNVAPPIISRLYQFLSDGVVGYNQARKIAYVGFPFPHAQTVSFFTVAVIFTFPWLYAAKVNIMWFAAFLNGITVLCFLGLHEVARELENPFANAPNDLPLTTFQAQFNEALVTMYAGFHPDSWWELEPESKSTSMGTSLVAASPTLSVPSAVAETPESVLLSEEEEEEDDAFLEIVGGDRNSSMDGSFD